MKYGKGSEKRPELNGRTGAMVRVQEIGCAKWKGTVNTEDRIWDGGVLLLKQPRTEKVFSANGFRIDVDVQSGTALASLN